MDAVLFLQIVKETSRVRKLEVKLVSTFLAQIPCFPRASLRFRYLALLIRVGTFKEFVAFPNTVVSRDF